MPLSVTVEDTDRGAALVFVTTGDVNEVRKRVAAMKDMHNEHHAAMGPLPTGAEASGGVILWLDAHYLRKVE